MKLRDWTFVVITVAVLVGSMTGFTIVICDVIGYDCQEYERKTTCS